MKNTSITLIYSVILLIAALLLIWNYTYGKRKSENPIEKTTSETKPEPVQQKMSPQPMPLPVQQQPEQK
jgi:hypothetical protein